MAGPPLSIVLPAYNEARRLPASLEALNRYLDAHAPEAEVVVADDGSTDKTAAAVLAAAELWPRVRLLTLPHRGKGHAVREGMLAALGEVRLFSDVDLAVPLGYVAAFQAASGSADVIIASREAPGAQRVGEPWRRHLMGRAFNLWVRLVSGLPYADTQCGFKAFRVAAAREIFARQQINGFGFDVEVLFLARRWGLRIAELPVEWRYGAESTVRLRHTVTTSLEVLGVRWSALRGRYRRSS